MDNRDVLATIKRIAKEDYQKQFTDQQATDCIPFIQEGVEILGENRRAISLSIKRYIFSKMIEEWESEQTGIE